MSDQQLREQFALYSQWRSNLTEQINRYRNWLNTEEIGDRQTDLRLELLADRLADDKLTVAFVAEFSRGKSELINAIFFADYKSRLLPSTSGRTTMCPTELLYDPAMPPSVRLLPITTRSTSVSISEYKRYPDQWTTFPLDIHSAEAMQQVLARVSETERVSGQQAEVYGLFNPEDPDASLNLKPDGLVEIPRWRHAIINFPHPLLQQGLVILDTPGLNAIGTEPELTFNLLPNAHAVIFLLAADTGVTRSDLDIWRSYVINRQGNHRGHLIVLNKIDGLWDDLKSDSEINAEINRQIGSCADMLGVPPDRIYPLSAQKALLAKISEDEALLARSGLPRLEVALSEQLIPAKQDIVRDNTGNEIEDLVTHSHQLLQGRMRGIDEQLEELVSLRGKNEEVVHHMMLKVEEEKASFERGLIQFHALRRVFSQHSNQLFSHLGMEKLRNEVKNTRLAMEQSHFTSGMQSAMNDFFQRVRQNITQSSETIDEIREMMSAMYRKFRLEHGLTEITPPSYSTLKYQKEMERLEDSYNTHFNTLYNLLTNEQYTLTAKFFETLASRVVDLYETANREAEGWLKAVMSPMESQVREHQMQLRRRLESIKRIHRASETLEERITELEDMKAAIAKQIAELQRLHARISEALQSPHTLDQAA